MAHRDERIDLNSAGVGELTQLPGVAKNVAYNIINHRDRYGWFTDWEELEAVKDFPAGKLEDIRQRAALIVPDGEPGARHLQEGVPAKRTRNGGKTSKLRSGRRGEKLRSRAGRSRR